LKIKTNKNKINWAIGLTFLIIGIGLTYDGVADFLKYNFTTVLFVFMRSNSSIIAEFTFGFLLTYSGIQLLIKNKSKLNIIKVLMIGVISNMLLALSLRALLNGFDLELLGRIVLSILFGFGIYKLTQYLIWINHLDRDLKKQKVIFLIGIIIGLFPFLFRNIYF